MRYSLGTFEIVAPRGENNNQGEFPYTVQYTVLDSQAPGEKIVKLQTLFIPGSITNSETNPFLYNMLVMMVNVMYNGGNGMPSKA